MLMDSTLHYTSVSHSGSLMATINKMRVNSDLCDVTLVVGEYRIMAHRIILSASAPFFYQMLQLQSHSPHHHHTNNNNNNNEVQLNNIDEIAALKIIEFCYTSAISLDDDTVWPLLAASIKFQLPEICTFCCEFLVASLDASNCVLSLRLAAKVHCPQLEENCVRFLLENIEQACASGGLTSLVPPELSSLLSVLALHDVGPATMAKLVRVWMDADQPTRQMGGGLAQLLHGFPTMAPYLHQFSQQNGPGNTRRGANGADTRVGGGQDFKLKGTSGNDSDIVNRKSSSDKETTRTATAFGKRLMPQTAYGDSTDKGRELERQEDEEMAKDKGRCGFGTGASGEFICISCGDDFDSQSDLMSHQGECGESARMVGSGGGESLREGLSGGRKGSVGGGDDEGEDRLSKVQIENSGLNLRKRKMIDNDGENGDASSGEGKNGKMMLSDGETIGSGNGELSESKDGSRGSGSSSNGDGKDLNVEENEGCENSSDERTPDSVDAAVCKSDGVEGEGHTACTNDDNNNDIHRQGGGGEFHDKDEVPDQRVDDGDLDMKVKLDDASRSDTTGSGDRLGKGSSSSYPDILTPSSVHSMESHFKTRKLPDIHGMSSASGHRYSSSSCGLSSTVAVSSSSSSSSSSSLHNLRPQQRCQICGRSFWEWKQLSQHWVLDHGIKTTRAGVEGNNFDGDGSLSPTLHRQSKSSRSSKVSPGKETPADVAGLAANSSWPYIGQGSAVDSLFKQGSAFRNLKKNGWEDDEMVGGRLSGQDSNPAQFHCGVDGKGTIGDGAGVRRPDSHGRFGGNHHDDDDIKFNVDSRIQSRSPLVERGQGHSQYARDSPSSLVNQEQRQGTKEATTPTISGKDTVDLKTSFLSPGNLVSPVGHQQGGVVPSSEFITNYLNHYNKLAQWCLAQGPNFCPSCFVHHADGSPCPRSQAGLSLEKHPHPPQSCPSTPTPDASAVKKEKMKEERVDVEEEEEEEEDREVNVDEVEDEGPLDMSKSSLEFSHPRRMNASSSSISPSTSISSNNTHQFVSPPANPHNPPLSSSTPLVIPPSYYGYGHHFLSGNSIIDSMSAAIKAAGGNLADLIPRQSPVQDLTSATQTGSGRDQQQQHATYNSYLHHQALSASAIAAQSSMANNSNTNGSLASAVFSSMARPPHNGLNGGVVGGHDISSASSPSSIFSFPSSPPNPNNAAASTSISTPSSSHLPSPSTSGGKKKSSSTPSTIPPKQGFPCTVCSRVYSHQSALFTHMRSHSPSARSYRCQFCNQTFARAPDLKVHVCPNGIEKPFTCPSCGQTFAKNIHLKRHLATHSGLKPYPCWVCGKRFSRSDHLKRHTQSIHAGARPHACHICGKEFVRKYELNKHMTSHN